jgi:hypothetical protein
VTTVIPPHPAKFSKQVLEVIADIIPPNVDVLDPMAGVGWPLVNALPGRRIIGIEIEADWAAAHPCVRQGNAKHLPFADGEYTWAVTSCTYANRMADSHNAQERCKPCGATGILDGEPCEKCGGVGRRVYKRLTYTHQIGHELHPENTGRMQWGKRYRSEHEAIWAELRRVLARNASTFILSISDHIRAKKVVPVTDWHIETLEDLGFVLIDKWPVETDRMGFGANRDARVDNEWVLVFRG